MTAIWKKSKNTEFRHIKESDKYAYYMEYTVGGGHQASEANRLILNFKKDIKKMKSEYSETEHRNNAINKFAKALDYPICKILKKYKKSINISFIPISTSKKDPHYNDRFELVCKKLKNKFQNDDISFHFPIEVKKSRPKSSGRSQTRDEAYIKGLKDNFFWKKFSFNEPNILVVIDDVITTGAQFRAYKEFLLENMKSKPGEIIGLFWAKAIHNNEVDFKPVELEDIQ